MLRSDKFTIDDSSFFEGFTDGETWNEWECPLFTKEQAMDLIRRWPKPQPGYPDPIFAADEDKFVFSMQEVAGDNVDFLGEQPIRVMNGKRYVVEEFGSVTIEGTRYYPIGSGSWVWGKATSASGEASLS